MARGAAEALGVARLGAFDDAVAADGVDAEDAILGAAERDDGDGEERPELHAEVPAAIIWPSTASCSEAPPSVYSICFCHR